MRPRWRAWRTSRPFWGAVLTILGGAEMLVAVKAPLPVVLHVGMQGLVGYLVPAIILLCGVLLLVTPAQRVFYSIVAALLALVSWATSNLGGFVLGLALTLIGSALAFAWTPHRTRISSPTDTPPPLDTSAPARKSPAHSAEMRAHDHETPAPSHGDQPAQT